ncbi:MAG: DNA primase [Firmicutes bacterium]|nr:DNA primase [Bacillota bacterium]
MAGFSEQIIEEVRSRSDVVEVISEYVSLKRRGKSYVGLCPFHSERTPSFNVVPDKQIFHCFGCQAGGDVFHFIQMRENVSFPEAVRLLAERAGISLEDDRNPAEQAREREQARLRQALDWAAKFFQYELRQASGQPSLEYLRKRGLAEETMERFGLGAAPQGWDSLYRLMTRRGFEPETLVKAGLVQPRPHGNGYFDRFRNRVMFPIWDIRGRVIGFGGRALVDGQGPKYMNSSESPLFEKGRNLYALHLAKGPMRDKDQAVMVEGYMDVIACHQAGVTNVVASLGTALTADQGRLLLQQAPRVVIAYDSDAAGQNATLRGLDILGGLGCQVSVLALPEGKDPDEFLRSHSADEFRSLTEKALPLVEFRLEALLRKFGAASPEAKAQVVRNAEPVLAGLTDEVSRSEYIRWLAGRLGVSEGALRLDLRKFVARQRADAGHTRGKSWHNSGEILGAERGEPAPEEVDLPAERLRAERLAVQLLLRSPELVGGQGGFTTSLLEHPVYRRIAQSVLTAGQTAGQTGAASPEDVVQRALRDLAEEDVRVAATLLAAPKPEGDLGRSFADCIQAIQQHILRRRLAELHVIIEKSASDQERLAALQEYQGLVGKTKRPKIASQ